MTDKAAAALVQEYEANNKTIAHLRSVLSTAGRQMSVLGDQLQRNPAQVTADHGEFSITDEFYVSNMGGVAVVEHRAISAEAIEKNLFELKSCMENKQRIEDRLKEAGLGAHIQKATRAEGAPGR